MDLFISNSQKYKNEFLYDKKKQEKMYTLFKDACRINISNTAVNIKKDILFSRSGILAITDGREETLEDSTTNCNTVVADG